jgi:hypothetical protein
MQIKKLVIHNAIPKAIRKKSLYKIVLCQDCKDSADDEINKFITNKENKYEIKKIQPYLNILRNFLHYTGRGW